MQSNYQRCFCGSGKNAISCCYQVRESEIDQAKAISKYPIFECFVGGLWKTNGQAPISIVRINMKNPSHVSLSCYLIDLWCLGVKDAFVKPKLSLSEFFAHKKKSEEVMGGLENISYEDARSLIFGGLQYALSLGFP